MQEKSFISRLIGHFKTITKHKLLVGFLCFKAGMYKQGLLHDLSKYSPIEFIAGVKYYQGYRSPIDAEKEEIGYSRAWLHHKGRNRHHWEYWFDMDKNSIYMLPLDMPQNYILEAVLDRIAACKVYQKEAYTDASAYDYFMNTHARFVMHPATAKKTAELLNYLKNHGEKAALKYYKELYKSYKKSK